MVKDPGLAAVLRMIGTAMAQELLREEFERRQSKAKPDRGERGGRTLSAKRKDAGDGR